MDGAISSLRGAMAPAKLVIGLVNNMAAGAMAATVEQFSTAFAETGMPFELRNLTLKDASDATDCTPIDGVPDDDISAFVVTGMEPSKGDLREEWLWPRLVDFHDWCEENSKPVIWSCLAAHAAVQHSSQIGRRRLDSKLSGIFGCTRAAKHPLMKAMPDAWKWPHSRFNGVEEAALAAKGYAILSRAGAAGVDIFARMDGTPFLYFQGHPEYQPETLWREYIRDSRRFTSGESQIQPALPIGYANTDALQQDGWQEARRKLFRNWMEITAAHAAGHAPSLRQFNTGKQTVGLFEAAVT